MILFPLPAIRMWLTYPRGSPESGVFPQGGELEIEKWELLLDAWSALANTDPDRTGSIDTAHINVLAETGALLLPLLLTAFQSC